jgi:hypothetical protein
MHLKEINGMSRGTRTRFFTNIRREDDLDDFLFNTWKNELKKELPTFWESISKLHKEEH